MISSPVEAEQKKSVVFGDMLGRADDGWVAVRFGDLLPTFTYESFVKSIFRYEIVIVAISINYKNNSLITSPTT